MSNQLELGAEFTALARAIMRTKGTDDLLAYNERVHGDRGRILSVTKAAVAGNSLADGWMSADGKVLADGYLATLRNRSILDLLASLSLNLPIDTSRFVLASGVVAHDVDEGRGKAVSRAIPNAESLTYKKVAGLVVLSKELAMSNDSAALRIFKNALDDAVLRSGNKVALNAFGTSTIATTGSARGDLAAGVAAAADSNAYIVVAPHGIVEQLAITSERPNFGIAGGEYVPGIHVIASNDVAKLTVLPTANFVMQDFGFTVRHAESATVEMSDSPDGTGEVVSLFQANLLGIMAERQIRYAPGNYKVEVG